jgi:hypothetical protein
LRDSFTSSATCSGPVAGRSASRGVRRSGGDCVQEYAVGVDRQPAGRQPLAFAALNDDTIRLQALPQVARQGPEKILTRVLAAALEHEQQGILDLFLLTDVGQGQMQHRSFSINPAAVHARVKDPLIAPAQRQLEILPGLLLADLVEQILPAFTVFKGDEMSERLADQPLSFHREQRRGGEVRLGDQAASGQREVTDGSKLIEIEVAVARILQCGLRPPQFIILHFKLDLVHLQLVHQFFGRSPSRRRQGICRALFSGGAQGHLAPRLHRTASLLICLDKTSRTGHQRSLSTSSSRVG